MEFGIAARQSETNQPPRRLARLGKPGTGKRGEIDITVKSWLGYGLSKLMNVGLPRGWWLRSGRW